MTDYPIKTIETADAEARPALERLKASVGAIPNLAGAMANSPAMITAFEANRTISIRMSTLSAAEREILSLTNAVTNGCSYCVAIHSLFAEKAGAPMQAVSALRTGEAVEDEKLSALSWYSRSLIENRGVADCEAAAAFEAAGYTAGQALEVVVLIANSVLANYSRHITGAPLDEMLASHAWKASERKTA